MEPVRDRRIYDETRGDVLLNPLDARSPDWSPWAEMREIADAYRIAKSMIPSVQGENNFFHVGAQDLFATFLVRLLRLKERSLLGLLEATLVMPRAAKAHLLRRSAAAKHYEGEHRSGHDVDATMAVYTQSLRFLRRTAGGRGDFSIRDFITDTVTRLEKPDADAIAAIRARFEGELAQLREARNHLAAGELRRAFRLVARVAISYPLLPDGMEPPEPDDDFAAWWDAHRTQIEAHWRAQDATMPEALAALEQAHKEAAARLRKRGAPWLFIGSTQRQMHAVRPLLSLWLDAVADTILSLPDNRGRRIWLMLDELQALQMLPSLQPLLTEGAKYGVCVCAGVQNMGQIR
ncbi:type IV secretion system DNA-binding domain-containing protein, partial [Rubrimonas sp.]|uniref:type IV secretion system DNA-binding domain-containing protein n=1 Tax=Rubrimonas sp. TaxID=2036015 RepID=UPI002FDD734D